MSTLALVSTYPPLKCGIGTYSEALAGALLEADAGLQVVVAAEEGSGARDDGRLRVVPCYRRDEDYVGPLMAALRDIAPDVVHVQHAPDLFGEDERLPRLIDALAARGIPSVVTLHTVYGASQRGLGREGAAAGELYRGLARNGHVIVHHESMRATLEEHGVLTESTTAIPHGTRIFEPEPVAEARARLGLPTGGTVFLHFGFIHAQKNLHTALLGFLAAAAVARDARLVVAGSPGGGKVYNKAYVSAMRLLGAPLRGRVVWHDHFIPGDLIETYFAASDVVLLPHAFQAYGSASGVFHLAAGAGRAVIASRQPKFVELSEIGSVPPECVVSALDIPGWARSIARMARDPELRSKAAAGLRAHAEETSWPSVARRHLDLYSKLT